MSRPIAVKAGRDEAEIRRRGRMYADRIVRLRQDKALADVSPIRGEQQITHKSYWDEVWTTAYLRFWRMSHGQNPTAGPPA